MLLFALWACAARTAPPGPAIGAPTPPATADPAAVPDCGAWSGMAGVGTRWEATATADYTARHGVAGTAATVVTAAAGDRVELLHTGTYAGEGGRFVVERRETWRCDAAGAWWIASVATSSAAWEGGGSVVTVERSFSPGILVRPAAPTPGAAWSTPTTVVVRAQGGPPVTTQGECRYEVGAEATAVVPAGARAARELRIECPGTRVPATRLAPGVGWLSDPDLELTAYRPSR